MDKQGRDKTQNSGRFDAYIVDFARRERHRTAATYHALLAQFDGWLAERELTDFDSADVLEFLDGQKWGNASRNAFLAAIRGWSKDAKLRVDTGTTLKEIQRGRKHEKRLERIMSIKDYHLERKEKPALSLEQISTLFDVMDPDTSNLYWLLLWFGVRVGELKSIENVDWEHGRLEVETLKAGGARPLFFDTYTARILKHAIDQGLIYYTEAKIWRMFQRYSGFLSPIKLGPHLCRHTFATHFARLTDRDTLRKMLGHSPQSSTDIYVHPTEERIHEVMVVRHYLKPLEPEVTE